MVRGSDLGADPSLCLGTCAPPKPGHLRINLGLISVCMQSYTVLLQNVLTCFHLRKGVLKLEIKCPPPPFAHAFCGFLRPERDSSSSAAELCDLMDSAGSPGALERPAHRHQVRREGATSDRVPPLLGQRCLEQTGVPMFDLSFLRRHGDRKLQSGEKIHHHSFLICYT